VPRRRSSPSSCSQLADEGAIDLDAGIDGYLPDLAGANLITPRQLLRHTSGLNDYKELPAVIADAQREWTPSELIAVAEAGGTGRENRVARSTTRTPTTSCSARSSTR
jgi:CubicO group peptidase (beta-lactamase class C family)